MIKELLEKRNQLIEKMEEITKAANEEKRAFTDEETANFDSYKEEIRAIDETIKREEEMRGIDKFEEIENTDSNTEEQEIRAFAQYIRGRNEARSEKNLTFSDNGAVVPKTIAKRIISRTKELSNVLNRASVYNVKGELSFPYYDETSDKIEVAYHDEFTKLTSSSATFKSVSLKGHLVGAFSKVSRSLINNSDFDITSYIVDKMAEAFNTFFEKELLTGKSKMQGVINAKQVVTLTSSTAITADDIIDLQMAIPTVYVKDAVWVMHRDTLKALRKLKNQNGDYLLNKDLTRGYGWEILGNHVEISENMDKIGSGKEVIFFGDMKGLAVKFAEQLEIQVLREKFADEHAIGIVGWAEVDSKIVEEQKIAVMKMGA